MIVTGNIKKIMYMGKEISEARNTDRTVWVKQTVCLKNESTETA